jgi:hypothetical protein
MKDETAEDGCTGYDRALLRRAVLAESPTPLLPGRPTLYHRESSFGNPNPGLGIVNRRRQEGVVRPRTIPPGVPAEDRLTGRTSWCVRRGRARTPPRIGPGGPTPGRGGPAPLDTKKPPHFRAGALVNRVSDSISYGTISRMTTRRFCCRPAAVALSPTGSCVPRASTVMREGSMLWRLTR